MSVSNENIILIDDEKSICNSLSALLAEEGYKVDFFQDSTVAAETIRNHKVDLVITDIKMPDLNGLDLLQIVKEVDEDIPVILMTGYASLDSSIEAITSGAYDYLLKPLDFKQFKKTVIKALEKRRSSLARLRLLEELKISNLILHRRINELNSLYEAGKSIGSTANLKELLRQIVALATHVTDAQVGSIMLLDDRKEYLTIEAAIGLEDNIIDTTRLPIGTSIAGFVAKNGEPLIINDIENDKRFKRINKEKYGEASLLCAPLVIKNKVIGVINMANKLSGGSFSNNDLRLLTTFASQVAVAIDDANQFEKNRRRLIEFEILHEISNELPQIQSLSDFRERLIEKLSRVFPIDYSIWFNWDEENKILIVDGAFGIPDIPLTNSGKIDLREIKWDDLILKPFDKKVDFHDIGAVTKALASKLTKNNFLPSPKNGYMAIPIFKYGDLAHIFYLGANSNSIYSEEDISLAKLIISQSAILFEKEKSLLNATRLLTMGNMISEISHDLRRPLTTIKGGLQIIKKRKSEIFQNSELLKNVEDEVYRMNELVRELVDFSNPQKYQTEKVDLRLIINKTSEMVKPDLRKQHIQFQTEFGEADWSVIVNKNQILEVFINLFINAIEAMPKGGQLSINGLVEVPPHKKVEYLALHISDTGVGIKKKNLSKIFDRYFTSKQTGTGLGLAVVERIISAHNGTLKVTSKDGKGTTFSVYFPYGTNI